MFCHVNMSFPLFCPSKFILKKQSNIQNPPDTSSILIGFLWGSKNNGRSLYFLKNLGSIFPIQQQKNQRSFGAQMSGCHLVWFREATPSKLCPGRSTTGSGASCGLISFQIKSCSCLGKEKGIGNIYVLISHVWK